MIILKKHRLNLTCSLLLICRCFPDTIFDILDHRWNATVFPGDICRSVHENSRNTSMEHRTHNERFVIYYYSQDSLLVQNDSVWINVAFRRWFCHKSCDPAAPDIFIVKVGFRKTDWFGWFTIGGIGLVRSMSQVILSDWQLLLMSIEMCLFTNNWDKQKSFPEWSTSTRQTQVK